MFPENLALLLFSVFGNEYAFRVSPVEVCALISSVSFVFLFVIFFGFFLLLLSVFVVVVVVDDAVVVIIVVDAVVAVVFFSFLFCLFI